MSEVRPIEVELKYRVLNRGAADRFVEGEGVEGFEPIGQVRSVQYDDRYVDTPDAALARAGFGARLRQAGNGLVISVKSLTRSAGVGTAHRREELEGPADRAMPPSDWPPSAARSLVLELAGDAPLVEVVTVRQLRRKREFRRDGTLLEVSIDEVDVVVRGDVVERFEELELEVREGSDEALARLEEILSTVDGLEAADRSKLERALEAAHRVSNGSVALADLVLARARDGRTGGSDDGDGTAIDGTDGAPDEVVVPMAEPQLETASDALAATTVEPPLEPGAEGSRPRKGRANRRRERLERASVAAGAEAAPGTAAETGDGDGAPEESLVPAALAPLHVGRSPGVLAEDHIAEAGRKVLRFHLGRMLAVEPGTRSGVDPEDLHKMRVATRRQRAAWRVFGDAYDPKRTKRYRDRLRVVARRLGAVRDLDVLIENGAAYQGTLPGPEAAAFEPLVASWRLRRDDARALLVQELDAPRHLAWLEDYRDFVLSDGRGARPVAPTEAHRVRDTMPSRIWAAYEGVRAYEPVLRWADVTTLHDLRIAGKWLRYTVEFVREALGPEAAGLIERVVALQDHLGLLNDADVAAGLARQFLVQNAGELDEPESAAIGRYLVEREQERARLRRAVGPAWRGVAGLTFRRQLGRVVAAL